MGLYEPFSDLSKRSPMVIAAIALPSPNMEAPTLGSKGMLKGTQYHLRGPIPHPIGGFGEVWFEPYA